MKPGYQQTDVGLIPHDWEVVLLGELGSVVRGGSPRPAGDLRYFNGNYIPWLTVGSLTNIPSSQLFVNDTMTMLTEEGAKYSRTLPEGTLVIVNSGAKTLGVSKILSITCCANDGIAALVNQRSGDKRFICYFLNGQIKRLREVVAAGNDQLNLNTDRIAQIAIPFPSEAEQRVIADALSDVDALLGALGRLIDKKRDVKQAAMQQLLNGLTRLPGFHAKWSAVLLGSVSTLAKGTQLHSSEIEEGAKFPHLNGGITPSGFTNKSNTPANTIAISEGGNSCGFVQFMTEPFWAGGHCYTCVPHGIDNGYLYHALKGRQAAIMALRVGSGLPNVQKTRLVNFELRVPSEVAEQNAIAEVLNEMDAELAGLELRLQKTRAIKQSMMQELLTGRTRLVSTESVHV